MAKTLLATAALAALLASAPALGENRDPRQARPAATEDLSAGTGAEAENYNRQPGASPAGGTRMPSSVPGIGSGGSQANDTQAAVNSGALRTLHGPNAPPQGQTASDQGASGQSASGQGASAQDGDDLPMARLQVVESSKVQGSRVSTPKGEDLGEIEQVLLDPQQGRITYAVVGVGGFLGIGEKSVAVPWPALQPSTREQAFVLNTTREQLETAPEFKEDQMQALADPRRAQEIHAFYSQQPYWQGAQQAEMPAGKAGPSGATPAPDDTPPSR